MVESIPEQVLMLQINKFVCDTLIVKRNDWHTQNKKNLIESVIKITKDEIKVKENFRVFFSRVEDRNPHVCFICGFYLTNEEHLQGLAKKPTGFTDFVHTNCYKFPNVSFDSLHGKLNDKSLLICHFDSSEQIVKKPRLCRTKVPNDEKSVILHLSKTHGQNETRDFPELWLSYRNQYFLKPNGKPFKQ